ncbi:hypothetical protein OBBRIDRAFT_726470, partial [Obba rivulosa]
MDDRGTSLHILSSLYDTGVAPPNSYANLPVHNAAVTAPSLPPELSDHIVDHLRGDYDALKTCTLTCRAWLPRARFWLFKRISI